MEQSSHNEPDYAFGQSMLTLRSTLGLTQAAVAEFLGVSRRTVVSWESGTRYPTGHHLKEFIALAVQQGAFPPGREDEAIRSLWRASRQKVLLDEAWLASLLRQSSTLASPPATQTPGFLPAFAGALVGPRLDWANALSISTFYGRTWELDLLAEWTVEESCRVVGVLGLGGIGKSALAVTFMRQVASRFDVVIWRSLRDAPTVDALLDDCLRAAGPEVFGAGDGAGELSTERRLNALLEYMRQARMLLVLDNLETVLEEGAGSGGHPAGVMRAGYEGFSRLLHLVAETEHQSCLLFTSREKPAELVPFEGNRAPVRTLRLPGLDAEACDALLTEKEVKGSAPERGRLINTYAANPLALKIVAQTIVDLLGGEPGPFLEQGGVIFGGVRDFLAEQFDRLSPLEQSIMIWLAILREPASLETLRTVLATPVSRVQLLEGVEALHRRSLVERSNQPGSFTLQSVVLEYVISRLITDVYREIEAGRPDRMIEYGLERAQAPDYVRQTQERLIGQPILQRLVATSGASGAETRLLSLLEGWRGESHKEQGYGPGNVVNLLRLLRGNPSTGSGQALRGTDLSHLFIRQVYLQEADAQDVSLAGSYLSECALADAFDFCVPVSFSPDGRYLAAGTHSGEVCVWQLADRMRIVSTQGHRGAVYGVEWASDGRRLATCGADGMVKLWEAQTGQFLATLEGHTGVVRNVCFSKDGHLIASSSLDATVKLWEAGTGRLLHTLQGHEGGVWGMALSTNASRIASASADGTVKLWDTSSGSVLTTLEGHSGVVYDVAFTPDGQLVASCGQDRLIRLWEVATGHLVATLEGHAQLIWHIAVSADMLLVAAGRLYSRPAPRYATVRVVPYAVSVRRADQSANRQD